MELLPTGESFFCINILLLLWVFSEALHQKRKKASMKA